MNGTALTLPRPAGPDSSRLPHRLARRLLHPFRRWRRPEPGQVHRLAELVTRQPRLQRWLLVLASETPRLRRRLFHRAAQEFTGASARPLEAAALEELAFPRLLDAVVESLLCSARLEPLPAARRTGRTARVRLAELAERLQHPAGLVS